MFEQGLLALWESMGVANLQWGQALGIDGSLDGHPLDRPPLQILPGWTVEDHRITIPGFYDDVVELSAEERAKMNETPFDLEKYKKDLDIGDIQGETGFTTLERVSIRPTLDVNGIWGTADDDMYVAGWWQITNYEHAGEIYHFDGSAWTEAALFPGMGFTAIWGTAADDIFAVGDVAGPLVREFVEAEVDRPAHRADQPGRLAVHAHIQYRRGLAQTLLAQLLRDLASNGRLIMASHHDLKTVGDIFDQVVLLNGTLIAEGPSADVMSEANLTRAFGESE